MRYRALLLLGSAAACVGEEPASDMLDEEVRYHDDLKADGVPILPPRLWPGGVLPIAFDGDPSRADRAELERACWAWANVADVTCVPHTDQPSWVTIAASDRNSSYLGRGTGNQPMELKDWRAHVIAHELGHALGRAHEQSRADRDEYVEILWENVEAGREHNFRIEARVPSFHPYDFDSIMHYGPRLMSATGEPTIAARAAYASQGALMGNTTHLSFGDRMEMVARYGFPRLGLGEVRVLTDVHGGFLRFLVDVPPEGGGLMVETRGAGNADLYLRHGDCPTRLDEAAWSSAYPDGTERIFVDAAEPGRYCVLVHARTAYQGVGLTAWLL